MPDAGDAPLFIVAQGEDYIAQMFWTDDLGNPALCSAPVVFTVADTTGNPVIVANDQAQVGAESAIQVDGANGLYTLSIPSAVTAALADGNYQCELFGTVNDPESPIQPQTVKLFSGFLEVQASLTSFPLAG